MLLEWLNMPLKEKKITTPLAVHLDTIIPFMGRLWSGSDLDNIILRFYDLVWYLRINTIYKIKIPIVYITNIILFFKVQIRLNKFNELLNGSIVKQYTINCHLFLNWL